MSLCRLLGCGFVACGALLWGAPGTAAEPEVPTSDAVSSDEAEFAALVAECLDLVLKHHVDPPTRQELLLAGVRGMHGQDAPLGLARTISTLATPEQVQEYLNGLAVGFAAGPDSPADARRAAVSRFLGGALLAAGDGSRIMPPLAFGRNESIRENRYVGIGIALSKGEDGWPAMARVFPDGPAHKAGIPDGSLILEADGKSTQGLTLEEVVVLLTGPKGSAIDLLLRHPGAAEAQSTRLVRDVIPFRTVLGIGGNSQSPGDYTIASAPEIGYASFASIGPSTTHELRELERKLIAAGCRGLVIDLRSAHQGRLHDGVILADALLGSGTIGCSRDADGEQVYEAQADEMFAGWPVVVLVDAGTHGVAEWVAAAWQDQRRAEIVGQATSGSPWCMSAVKLPSGLGALEMRTALLARGDGRSLLRPDDGTVADDEVQWIERLKRRHDAARDAPSGEQSTEPDAAQAWGVTPDHRIRRPRTANPPIYVAPQGATPVPNAAGQRIIATGPVQAVQAPTAEDQDPLAVAVDILRRQLNKRVDHPQ